MKKEFLSFVLAIIFMSSLIPLSSVNAQPDPDLTKLNKSSQYKGLMYNMKAPYESAPIEANDIKSSSQFLFFDLIFKKETSMYGLIKTELTKDLAICFQNKNVDIFGVGYYRHCYFSKEEQEKKEEDSSSKDKVCMYGGLTEHNSQEDSEVQPVSVTLYIDKQNKETFTIVPSKKTVTAQELDYKTRNYLIKKHNLYRFNDSPFETGYIKFIENGKESFWYDMMPPTDFSQSIYLKLYKDNKTVDSSKTHIEVHLTIN